MNKIIHNPFGSAIYDKETGITIRMDHVESGQLLDDYNPNTDYECPEVVHAELTSKCNLNCSYCYIPKETIELDYKKWTKIVGDLSELGIFQLTFGGGEPFLRGDICELARYADDCGINVTVTTNGMEIENFSIRELKIFRQINISYHEKAIQQGFSMEKALMRLGEAGIPTGINFIVSKSYKPHFPEVSELAIRCDINLILLSYKPIRGDYENCVDYKTINEMANNLAKKGIRIGIDSLISGECYQNERMCVISSSGDVYPCSFIRKSLGNITNQHIEEIWKSRGIKTECPYLNTH